MILLNKNQKSINKIFNNINIDFNIIKGYAIYKKKSGWKEILIVESIPDWMSNLDDEDVVFIKKFILASGSLKEVAGQYNVTYPTVRLKLDKLIQKIQIGDETGHEPYIALIKRLALNDKLDFDTAKVLINEYKKTKKERD